MLYVLVKIFKPKKRNGVFKRHAGGPACQRDKRKKRKGKEATEATKKRR